MTDLGAVLRLLYRGPRGAARCVANPYRDGVAGLDGPAAARRRRRNLEAYCQGVVGRPCLILVGEALGYRGGRFSGIAFTSERQLAGGGPKRLAWAAGGGFRATSSNAALWSEPSGTIVWRALGDDPRGVLLWNAFPWHPWGGRGPLSNRTPERSLLFANLHVLERLLAETGGAEVLAVGKTAQVALAACGLAAPALRHPAHGGAAIFRSQLERHLRR